jgi:hypothetical protein
MNSLSEEGVLKEVVFTAIVWFLDDQTLEATCFFTTESIS